MKKKVTKMSQIGGNTTHRLDALNNWLGDVYGVGTNLASLLYDAGITDREIEHLKQEHLDTFLQGIVNLLNRYQKRFSVGIVLHYGLSNGNPQSLEAIGQSVGVCRERVRQLIRMELIWYRDPVWKTRFIDNIAMMAHRLLMTKNTRQDHGMLR